MTSPLFEGEKPGCDSMITFLIAVTSPLIFYFLSNSTFFQTFFQDEDDDSEDESEIEGCDPHELLRSKSRYLNQGVTSHAGISHLSTE